MGNYTNKRCQLTFLLIKSVILGLWTSKNMFDMSTLALFSLFFFFFFFTVLLMLVTVISNGTLTKKAFADMVILYKDFVFI